MGNWDFKYFYEEFYGNCVVTMEHLGRYRTREQKDKESGTWLGNTQRGSSRSLGSNISTNLLNNDNKKIILI